MTTESVLRSRLGCLFEEVATELGQDPGQVLAGLMSEYINTAHEPEAVTNPGLTPPRRRRDASDEAVLGLWADRAESAAQIARRIRDANNTGRNYAD